MIRKIICDKCDKEVDHRTVHYDHSTDGWVFVVRCHNEWDRARFPNAFLADTWKFTEARCFIQRGDRRNNEIIEGEFSEVPTKEIGVTTPLPAPTLFGKMETSVMEVDSSGLCKAINTPSSERESVEHWAPLIKDAI